MEIWVQFQPHARHFSGQLFQSSSVLASYSFPGTHETASSPLYPLQLGACLFERLDWPGKGYSWIIHGIEVSRWYFVMVWHGMIPPSHICHLFLHLFLWFRNSEISQLFVLFTRIYLFLLICNSIGFIVPIHFHPWLIASMLTGACRSIVVWNGKFNNKATKFLTGMQLIAWPTSTSMQATLIIRCQGLPESNTLCICWEHSPSKLYKKKGFGRNVYDNQQPAIAEETLTVKPRG